MKDYKPYADEIRATIQTLTDPDDIVEFRFFGVSDDPQQQQQGKTYGGWIVARDIDKFLPKITALASISRGVSFSPQVLSSSVATRQPLGIFSARQGVELTGKKDIVRYRWLIIDIDPVRAKGHEGEMATYEERKAAAGLYEQLIDTIQDEPVLVVSSGNGFHLYYEMPAETTVIEAEAMLIVFAAKFNNHATKIDCMSMNLPMLRLPGTWAKKGEDTEERPWRIARIMNAVK